MLLKRKWVIFIYTVGYGFLNFFLAATAYNLVLCCSEQPKHYKGDPQCPIFMTSAPFFSASEACEILLNPGDKVCTKIPRSCRMSMTFVLDTSCLDHPNDFKADDNGSFRHHGINQEFIELNDDGEVTRIDATKTLQPGQYKLCRTY